MRTVARVTRRLNEGVCRPFQEQRLRYLKLQDQRQQQQEASEQERLRQLRENAHNQEAKLRRVRALRGQVEQKRLSNSKLGQCQRACSGAARRRWGIKNRRVHVST